MVDRKTMTHTVLIGQPGTEHNIQRKGVRIDACISVRSDISILPISVIKQVYQKKPLPYREGTWVCTNWGDGAAVPIVVGVEITSSHIACAQIDCIAVEDDRGIVIGNDVLKQLGLRVTLDYKQNQVLLDSYSWQTFEKEAAALYRALGAVVRHNVNLAGFQIDLRVEETTPSKQRIRLAVECKFYKERIGNRIVSDFGRVVSTLKESGVIDKGVIVASSGFTQDAYLVAEKTNLELLTIDDLRQAVTEQGISLPVVAPGKPSKPAARKSLKTRKEGKQIFVLMPFSSGLEDVYHLGIREVVAKLGASCERADEIEYVGGVVEKIYDSIKNADLVVAEITTPNPNVYYELGYAHALGIPVILLTQNAQATPFDLRGYRHIIYSSILDIRDKLDRLMRTLIELDNEIDE